MGKSLGRCECVVVGAGVVGLAIARALASAGREVLVVEANASVGAGVSARNSEVVHGGLYHPPGSLKATTCVAGRRLLYGYCAARGIAHRRVGKWVVATEPEQVDALAAVRARAEENGVEDLRWIDGRAARAAEPELRAVAALSSPHTGIVDSHGLVASLLRDAQARGAALALRTRVTRVIPTGAGVDVHLDGDHLSARWLINAAGLSATRLAAAIAGLPARFRPPGHFAKGSYFALLGCAPFSRLIYPVPAPGGLGIHLTLDLAGQARFGPDVEWLADAQPESMDYAVDPARAAGFYRAVRAYWPGLPDRSLRPDYAGVRPKLVGPGAAPADFRVDGPADHGVAGLINLLGIESPGLTAALALAEHVASRVH